MFEPAPLISVIIATYNAQATLERCFESLFNQTVNNFQVIVIDGASTDGTLEIIQRYAEKITYWDSQTDRGICHAWNKALAYATGQWFFFLGSDDYLYTRDIFHKIGTFMLEVPAETRVVYGKVALVDSEGRVLNLIGSPWEKARKIFNRSLSIPHQGIFHRRDLFDDHGGFDESLRLMGDYDFLSRELPVRNAYFVNEVIAGMQFGGISYNPSFSLIFLRELWQVQKKLGYTVPHPHWWLLAGKICVRSAVWNILGSERASTVWDFLRRLRGKPSLWSRL